jgi:thymidylate kinase
MAKLIAITGTHGTGKTTLSFQMAAEYKKMGANVKIIQEVARSCPFPLNADMTRETALWIYHEHSKKELEACRDHDIVICDRTSFDSFVYAEVLQLENIWREKKTAYMNLAFYSLLYFVRPDENSTPKEDGVRSTDLKFQSEIDSIFYKYLHDIPHMQIDSQDIFSNERSWTTY